ncbi:MAG: AMP-binding protein, partial [bacterium]|nr:AMP-binding protein [bacterium]
RLTYRELNNKANRLARILRNAGVNPENESVVGLMIERSVDMIIALLAILKAGGAYLPIDPQLPEERVRYMLDDSGTGILLTTSQDSAKIPFSSMSNFEKTKGREIEKTGPREHIKTFDKFPMPDRSLLDLRNYKNKIGMASVTNAISLQTTRGCPYECLFCHKIWSKKHVFRSAESIYEEIEHHYKNGVRNFACIDDCFNLKKENSARLFRMIIENKLKLQMFFPNGLRGDLMTPDYIALMAAAGTRGINLSLETASPRLQELLKKHLDLDKFKNVIEYISKQHPEIMLEMATMHGFPSETEEEAMMTLNFIKDIKWLHFPYIHILKIFPNTEMEEFALTQGIRKEDIMRSKDRAFHELPETLPFPKNFTRKYQAEFLNEYFLDKERLKHVLPIQMNILSEEALAQKYNAYLPVQIDNITDVVEFAQLNDFKLPQKNSAHTTAAPVIFDRKPAAETPKTGAPKIMFLDLSQHFSSHSMLYSVAEQPTGLVYLLTHLKRHLGDKIDGRIYKSGNDFDSFMELKQLIEAYKPDMVAIRTLTFFKEFFHQAVALIRQWGVQAPIITGGPYAASDYETLLKDEYIDLVVMGEGEATLLELVENMLKCDFQIPPHDVLREIKGIVFAKKAAAEAKSRNVIFADMPGNNLENENPDNLNLLTKGNNLAYVMYTSGSTGRPKGVMVEQRQVNNCIGWMQEKFALNETHRILQRTNLTFDPSVWEIFWPLYTGASVRLINTHQAKDPDFLIRLMAEDKETTMMYCPSTLVNAMTYLLENMDGAPELMMPRLIIGAEPITMDVIKRFYYYYKGMIVNTYGPTECTINNTYYDLATDSISTVVPIGRPVANNKSYILSKDMQPLPVGIPGEICIAGDSLARGYIGSKEKTDRAFIDNPYGKGKLYKTGDVGRWQDDGNIEIMGRIDQQIKIRGYRIEPGEIENLLMVHPDVKEAVVAVKDSSDFKIQLKVCKKCGITTNYPNTKIDEEDYCEICRNFERNKTYIDNYFKTLPQLKTEIGKNAKETAKYDCLLLYSGGRGSAYALYQLVEMGLKVLTITYDNGYFSKTDIANIKKITAKLNVDHISITHKNSDKILKESLKAVHTVCRGCFHTSSSIAGLYAYENN